MSPTGWVLSPVLLAVTLVLVAGCGGSGDDDGGEVGGREGPGEAASADELEPVVDDLLGEYDRIVNEVVTDPTVVQDDDSALVGDLRALFEDDSPTVDELVGLWESRVDEGLVTEPFEDGEPISRSRLDGDLVVVDADEVQFALCVERRFVVYEDGDLSQRVPYREQRGEGTAVRVDDEWRLSEIVMEESATCRLDSQVETGSEAGRESQQGSEG